MRLNLRNPLVFFDLETTGINIVKDRIVELSYVKVFPNGNEESKTMKINPEMPIPKESTAIHGITDEDVKDCPTFKEIAKSLAAQIEGATWQATTRIASTFRCWPRSFCAPVWRST